MQAKAKPMPIGVDDFKELVEKGYCFVDKTRFMGQLLESRGKVSLITRPRRFGKTLNLSMLRYFFTLEKAEENRRLFAGLEIEGTEWIEEQGTRPVVFLTLKGAQSGSFPGMMECLSELLRKLYEQFPGLEQSTSLSPRDSLYYSGILNETCSAEKMKFSLANLLMMLKKHYQKNPVLLLDEYNAPILAAWEKGYYQECIDFMRGFLGEALKSNEALDFAVLTGVTRVSKESIFSGLNNLEVCSVLSTRYSDIFGFTQEEAARLMTDCGREADWENLKRWYDGYLFGETEIYNPWSVINFIRNDCKFQPYWLNTSGNSILRTLLERVDARRQKDLEGLLQGIPVKAPVMENIVYADIESDRNTLYMMLLTAGYLKAVKVWKDARRRDTALLEIPNREIRQAFEDEIFRNVVPRQGYIVLEDMLDAMATGDAGGFAEYLSELLRDFVSFHDLDHSPESFYHGLLLGFSVLLEGSYRVESNRESGYGRFDIAFFPKKEGSPGILLELKAAKAGNELEALAKEALRQIEEKAYMAELSRQGVEEVWKYGIAFCGKRVWMEKG